MEEEVFFLPGYRFFTTDPAKAAEEWAEHADKLQDAINKLEAYFTSGNSCPVDKATIHASDFWQIIGKSDPSAIW